MKRSMTILLACLLALTLLGVSARSATAQGRQIGVNVVLKGDITNATLADLGKYGKVRDVLTSIDAVTMQIEESKLATVQALPYVAAANPDAVRSAGPITNLAADNFNGGVSTWNLDAINVTDFGFNNRQTALDGTGVYVAVLDTGLLQTWRYYFPESRIATQYGIAFGGGGGEVGNVSTQPDKWQRDQNSHGTHVTSTILGYSLDGTQVNGVAPNVKIIPVKVLGQSGSGWSSMIARGIVYVADLKASGALGSAPVVINMSLGGSVLDAVEKAALDYAISKGVLIVASAGNSGEAGMGYPGAYAPVISVAAAGWNKQWTAPAWWYALNVADPTNTSEFHIADFSSRQLPGQDLDVAAPGSWIVGSYQVNGQTSYYYLSGTSMAAPHVAGIVALMAQQNPTLSQAAAEAALEAAALPMAPACPTVIDPTYGPIQQCFGADATGAGLITVDGVLGGSTGGGGGKGGKK